MGSRARLEFLRTVPLLEQIPDAQLDTLGAFLVPLEVADGAVIIEEGAKDDSCFLYFVTGGRVRISKRLSKSVGKELALYKPGDCFGEMEVIDDVVRSAQAAAVGPTTLLRLHRDDMNRWLRSHPDLAGTFYPKLVRLVSRNLRRSSYELALICDLSRLLLEPFETGRELVAKVLAHIVPQLEGSWSAAAYLRNLFNEELDFVGAGCKPADFAALQDRLPPETESRDQWLSDRIYYVSLPGHKRPQGHLLFRSAADVKEDERTELGRILTTVARFLTSALENVDFRMDETLREQLKNETDYSPPPGGGE